MVREDKKGIHMLYLDALEQKLIVLLVTNNFQLMLLKGTLICPATEKLSLLLIYLLN